MAGAAQVSGSCEFGLLMQMFLFPLVSSRNSLLPGKKKSRWGKTVGRLIIQYTKFSDAPGPIFSSSCAKSHSCTVSGLCRLPGVGLESENVQISEGEQMGLGFNF